MSEGEEELNVGAVRLEEVASAANVSLSTASKALRGKPHVSEKTRIRVIDAARRLLPLWLSSPPVASTSPRRTWVPS